MANVSDVYIAKALILNNIPVSLLASKDNDEAQNGGKQSKKNKKKIENSMEILIFAIMKRK